MIRVNRCKSVKEIQILGIELVGGSESKKEAEILYVEIQLEIRILKF